MRGQRWKWQIEQAWAGATWFTAHLLRLIDKADRVNTERIRIGFPEEVAAYEAWKAGRLTDDWRYDE